MKNNKVNIKENKINYICLGSKCPKSCCGPFGGVQKGLDTLHDIEFCDITLTKEDRKKIITAGYFSFIEESSDGTYRIRLNEDGSCKAFINGQCVIHDFKPSICRAFPFYIDMFVGLCVVSGSCPGFGAGWTLLDDIKPEINAAKNIYNFWVNEYDKE